MKSNLPAILVLAAAIAVVSFVTLPLHAAVLSCILGFIMLAIAATDMREFIIPDIFSLPAIPTGLLATWLLAEPSEAAGVVLEHLLAAIVGGGGLYAIARIYEAARGHAGLGLGDVKLFAAGGAWIGWQGLPSVLLIASFAALGFVAFLWLVRGKTVRATTALPFGVFLAPAIWIIWVFDQILDAGVPSVLS